MPVAHASATYSDTTPADAERRASSALVVMVGLVALGTVLVGFLLVALTILDASSVPLEWGAGLCVSGWGLASLMRLRSTGRARRISEG